MQPSTDNIELSLELSSNKKKRKKQLLYKSSSGFKRALIDPQPLYISDNMLVNTLKDLVGQIHGDFGRASVATGKIKLYSVHPLHAILSYLSYSDLNTNLVFIIF